ncbi:reverse transcriptase domain-containing protein, partial [Tanacetum coccineum]
TGSLPSNTIANPKGELKAITTRSGASYDGHQVPSPTSSPPKVVERETEVTKDTVLPTNNRSTKDVQPSVVQVQSQVPNSKPVVDPVSALMSNPKLSIPYPLRRNDEKRHETANDQVEKFYKIFQNMSFEISLADALILMPKFASTLKALIGNKEKISEMARSPLNEHCSAVILNKLPKKLRDPDKFLIPYRSITKPIGIAEDVYLKVGKFKFPADFVVINFDADPRVPLILGRSFLKTGRALIDVYEGELTLRVGKEAITFNLDQTLRYSSNYDYITAKQINVIEMACEEYSQEVLGFSNVIASGNLTPYYDPIVSTSFSTLTPFGDSDFLLEEVDAFLALEDDPTSLNQKRPTVDPVTIAGEVVTTTNVVVSTAEVTTDSTTTTTVDELTLAQTLIEIKAAKPKARGAKDKGKAKMVKPKKPLKKKDQIMFDKKNIDREDLETLWELVKANHGLTRPDEGCERVLWGDLKARFEPDVESEVWRNL